MEDFHTSGRGQQDPKRRKVVPPSIQQEDDTTIDPDIQRLVDQAANAEVL